MEDCTNKKIGHLIASYELGLLDERDKARFENHALECVHCRRELNRLYPKLNLLHENRQDILNHLQANGFEVPDQEQKSEKRITEPMARRSYRLLNGLKNRKVMVPAFGLVVVLMISLILIRKPASDNPYLPYLSFKKAPYTSLEGSRDNQTEAERLFVEGMNSYSTDKFKEAAGYLQKSADLNSKSARTWLYLGISYYLDRQPASAIEVLDKAEEIADPVQKNWAIWYKAQAYILNGNPSSSIPLLQTLAEQGMEYSSEARKLLEKMRKISPELFNPI